MKDLDERGRVDKACHVKGKALACKHVLFGGGGIMVGMLEMWH
jgi:hypothetical protein